MIYVFLSFCLLGSSLALRNREIMCTDILVGNGFNKTALSGVWYEGARTTISDHSRCTKIEFTPVDDDIHVVYSIFSANQNRTDTGIGHIPDVSERAILDFKVNTTNSVKGHIVIMFPKIEPEYAIMYNCPPHSWEPSKRYASILFRSIMPRRLIRKEALAAAKFTMFEGGPEFLLLDPDNCTPYSKVK